MNTKLYSKNARRINNSILNIIKCRNYFQLKRLLLYGINYLLHPDSPKNPLMAVIGITNRCNLKCVICPRQTLLKGEKDIEMPFEKFKYIIDQLSFVDTINISGLGEPFLHKDLLKMIRYIKNKNISVSITSNGTLVTKAKARDLVNTKLDIISFSLDSPDPKTYEEVRRGAYFEETIENIRNLIGIKNKLGARTSIKINMVASNENFQKIPDFIDLAHQIDVSIVEVSPVRSSMDGFQFLPSDLPLHLAKKKDQINEVFALALKKAKKHGVSLTLPSIEQSSKWSSCLRPWYSSFITIEGNVRQCCASMQVFGNVFEEDIKDIWRNERFLNVRHRLRTNDIPESCVNCIFL